ncbi:craniofacial development protein 2-like [Elysia marginata]|uniref:Craniofacial development protein 2-like n=1 Tax=Elysia marginata TaxID=1093978 RepID=A0AAV4JH21_9GAST|nr:craniofacial development protein 2-like [Elysia marginata]
MDPSDTEHPESTETPDGIDLIEAVAHANDISESAATLPRLQSSPCPIHTRSYQQQHHLPMYRQQQLQQRNYSSMEPRNDLLYSTNCHGGQVRRSSSQASGHSGRRSNKSGNSGEMRRQEEERVQMEREKTFRQDVMAGKSQKYIRPVLPNEMASQDFVSSWIMHGSQPNGRSHFPDLIPDKGDDSSRILPFQHRDRNILCTSQDPLIIMEDFNAKVGQHGNEKAVSKHGLGIRNERGEQLVTWCDEQYLIIGNSYFERPARRKWTWKQPGDNSRNQIDFILAKERFRNALLSAKSYPGADCYSDHIPVIAKFRLKLKT